jgi:outer membrane protein insertion porin family
MKVFRLKNIVFLLLLLSSCTIIRKAPTKQPYLVANKIELEGGQFTKVERQAVIKRLGNQLDDSSKVNIKDALFVLHIIKNPVAYDTSYSSISALNMQSSMYHLGYYGAKASYSQDTINKKVTVKYKVVAGTPTLIDTLRYRLKKEDFQKIALASSNQTLLIKNTPITKIAVLAEVARLVDSFRNNGYYKFTAAELRMRGDSAIAALTSVADDPFEQLRLLSEAQTKRDSPTIKLALDINPPEDSTKLNKYYINKIYILSDYRADDVLSDTLNITERTTKNFILRYHERLFKSVLFARNITLKPGDVYSQREYFNTLSNLTKLGVWKSINIRIIENLDEANKIDLIIELLPGKKFLFENSIEASYSLSNSSTAVLGGNLFGVSTNFSLKNKNIAKEAISMTHNLRLGIELNNGARANNSNLVNSQEASYSNNVLIPRLLLPQKTIQDFKFRKGETFINTGVSYTNRLNFFSLQSFNLNTGFAASWKKERKISFRPLDAQFSYLYNQSDSFNTILDRNLFLRYSYNTSFTIGMAASYSSIYRNSRLPNSLSKERDFKLNVEESGLTWGLLPILNNYKKKYVKFDTEYKFTATKAKSAIAFRAFAGVGIPLFKETALPFFKQFYGGGSNSMRGWPVRGIGRGAQKLIPYNANSQNIFNDRTGDIQLELNTEFRHDIARIVPDFITLKGAVFIDAGNIWNMRDSKIGGVSDFTKFEFKNLYKQFGLSAGYGFRFDFSYLIVRTDFSFRFKRPESSDVNNGWKAPPIGFNDAFQKIFSKNFRQWRYENFNFTIGINYPF